MGLASVASGTKTTEIGTEQSLTQQTGVGIYVLLVDTDEMLAGDTLIVRVKTRHPDDASVKTALKDIYTDAQSEPHKYTIPVAIDTEIVCTIEQSTGIVIDCLWNLLRA